MPVRTPAQIPAQMPTQRRASEHQILDELPQGYYLRNFRFLIRFVRTHHAQLLNEPERRYADRFEDLPDDAQKLYVRLTQRKGPLFRVDKLSYADVDDLPLAIDRLIDAGYLGTGDEADIPEWLGLVARPALADMAREIGVSPGSLTKQALIDTLCEAGVDKPTLDVVEPLHADVLTIYKLLFFGNLSQDFAEFVLSELGLTPFESYELDAGSGHFEDRDHLDHQLMLYEASNLATELIAKAETDELVAFCDSLPVRVPRQPFARRYDRIVNRIARQLERYEADDAALDLYARTVETPSRERRARLLFKNNRIEECETLCREIFESPLQEQEQLFAIRFARKLKRHKSLFEPDDGVLTYQPPDQKIKLPDAGDQRVEDVAIDWFVAQGIDAYYVENALINSLFGLSFWDIIFASEPGAFFNPYQRGPADLFTGDFYTNRRLVLEERLHTLQDPARLHQLVTTNYETKYPKANHFVHWYLDRSLLERYLSVVDASKLVPVFRRLLMDPHRHRSGFPDLVVFDDRGARLVEVKGPNDRLQENQRLWLYHFHRAGLAAEVLYITYD